jgi:hypothetical protein
VPELDDLQHRKQPKDKCHQERSALGEKQNGPPVVPIGHQSSDHGETQHGYKPHTANYADRYGLAAELADVPKQRPLLHLAPDHGDDQATPNERELSVSQRWRQAEHG